MHGVHPDILRGACRIQHFCSALNEWLNETGLNDYTQSSACSPSTCGRCMRHSSSSAAPRFNSLANHVVCIFPEIMISYDSTIKLDIKLPNLHLNRNAGLFILFMFDQSRKLTFSRLMITSLFHTIYLSIFFYCGYLFICIYWRIYGLKYENSELKHIGSSRPTLST